LPVAANQELSWGKAGYKKTPI